MASGIFGIATSGLTAAQAGLATAGHNIANANTPGYHRQVVEQSNATPQLTGGGFIGRGVEVDSVRRMYNSFIDSQAARSEAQASYYSTYQAQVGQIDSLLSDPDAGLAPELERFFAAVNDVAGNAASVPSRQAMLAAGSSLIARFQALDGRLIQINQGLNVEIQSTVSSVNAYAKQIAGLNGRIAEAQSNPNQPPNDLIDERDRLVGQLNALVGANTIEHANGTVSLSIGSGQNLVVGNEVFQLTVMALRKCPNKWMSDIASAAAPCGSRTPPLRVAVSGRCSRFGRIRLRTLETSLGASPPASSSNSMHSTASGRISGVPQAGTFSRSPRPPSRRAPTTAAVENSRLRWSMHQRSSQAITASRTPPGTIASRALRTVTRPCLRDCRRPSTE
jgi:flagellar hook-associated protein 1 FlgK